MDATSQSLLDRLQHDPAPEAWGRWLDLYHPLIASWLRRHALQAADADDLAQQVLAKVVAELPAFRHNGRAGAFRAWLKAITLNCLRAFWRQQTRAEPHPWLDRWADPASDLSRQWDRDHDRHVLRHLLDRLEGEFAPTTWQAFRRLALEGAAPATVAGELGLTINAVSIAKSRVLTRLRQAARGLVDA
jgi:RNA polymerase sigma-70 factor (ECF subfamily)